jgi:hypothetical protein
MYNRNGDEVSGRSRYFVGTDGTEPTSKQVVGTELAMKFITLFPICLVSWPTPFYVEIRRTIRFVCVDVRYQVETI